MYVCMYVYVTYTLACKNFGSGVHASACHQYVFVTQCISVPHCVFYWYHNHLNVTVTLTPLKLTLVLFLQPEKPPSDSTPRLSR